MLKKLWHGLGYLPVVWSEDESNFLFRKPDPQEVLQTPSYIYSGVYSILHLDGYSEQDLKWPDIEAGAYQPQYDQLVDLERHPCLDMIGNRRISTLNNEVRFHNKAWEIIETVPYKAVSETLKTSLMKPKPFVKMNPVYDEKEWLVFTSWALKEYLAFEPVHNLLVIDFTQAKAYNTDADCLILWNLKKKSPTTYIRLPDSETVEQLYVTTDGEYLIVGIHNEPLYFSEKLNNKDFYSGIRVFSTQSGKEVFSFFSQKSFGSRFALTEDKRHLAVLVVAVPNHLVKEPSDELVELQVWDYAKQQIITSLLEPNLGCWAKWSPSGKYLLTGMIEPWFSDQHMPLDIFYSDQNNHQPYLHLWEWQK